MIKSIYPTFYHKLIAIPKVNYKVKLLDRNLKNIKNFKTYKKRIQNCFKDSDFIKYPIKYQLPKRSAIEINNTCNLNCLMCNTKLAKRPEGYIDLETFEHILKELSKVGIKKIPLHTVGEPFMYKRLDKLFEIIKKYNFKVSLSTNGQFPKRLKRILEKYYKNLKRVRFSIDGATQETYEYIRSGASYSRLIKSLEIAHKFNNYKINNKVRIDINAVISLTNLNEILLFFKAFGKYCWPENLSFGLINALTPDTKHFWEVFPFPNLIRSAVPCELPFKSIYFTYDGKATLCCRDYDGDLIVGDLSESSIVDIWNGRKSESIRKQQLNPELLTIDSCKRCYQAFPFISEILNELIHYIYHFYPKISNQKFSKIVLNFLRNLDKAMENKDELVIKETVLKYFIKN